MIKCEDCFEEATRFFSYKRIVPNHLRVYCDKHAAIFDIPNNWWWLEISKEEFVIKSVLES